MVNSNEPFGDRPGPFPEPPPMVPLWSLMGVAETAAIGELQDVAGFIGRSWWRRWVIKFASGGLIRFQKP